MSELRKNPFTGDWVVTATHRQDRTFLPPEGYCPLCPTQPGGFPTEIPFEDYEIAVFENKFPSFSTPPPEGILGLGLLEAKPSNGVCEVVCYMPRHDATFAQLGHEAVRNLCDVWQERYLDLIGREGVEYVFIFENKGREVGVTLTHPHGQIYAYPFVPPAPAARLKAEKAHLESTGRTLCQDWLDAELSDGRRVVYQKAGYVAVVPFFARYPYEVHVVPERQLSSLAEAEDRDLRGLSEALDWVAKAYDRLFGFSLPYMMGFHQDPDPATRLVVQFTPLHRTADKLKYLAGSEAHCGVFIVDALPEDAAAALRSAS